VKKTSWGPFARWLDDLLEKDGTYQKDLILPNLLRLSNIRKGESVLDIACGQGFFAREFYKAGANVTGIDISKELIEIAKKRSPFVIKYYTTEAKNIKPLANSSINKITIILALQNMEDVNKVFRECDRILKHNGAMYLVLSHPSFRIPKQSSWGWDEGRKIQYRRIDSYLSESRDKIQMHPGIKASEFTWSFHRPLQYYFKMLCKNGFCVTRLEEWNSHKKSEKGPRSNAEDKARHEIPLFMFIEAIKG